MKCTGREVKDSEEDVGTPDPGTHGYSGVGAFFKRVCSGTVHTVVGSWPLAAS